MKKLYPVAHTLIQYFKKQFLTFIVLLFFTCSGSVAQCLPAPVVNAVSNQILCNNTATTTINFTGTATSYNWTNSNSSIGLAAAGTDNIASFTVINSTATAVTATITVTPVSGVCTGTPINFTITVNPSPALVVSPAVSCGAVPNGTGPCNPVTASGADSYIWTPVTGLYNNCTLTVPYTGANAATVYAAPITSTTYTVTGTNAATGCSKTATALVNYTPLAPVVIPNPASMCLNDPLLKIKIAPSNYCSGSVNIAVPDNNPAGVSNSISVSGMPVGCTISGMRVTINMTHTRIGDMIMVLKAPNGNILNLNYTITGTGGNGTTTGFVNTIFSSAGTVPLSAGINPYTGVFKADAWISATGSGPAPGPTGMLPTVQNFPSLWTTVNGNWTLGLYDAATGETGSLNSWCIQFISACSSISPSTAGIWSPINGLFSDPAATIPYTGAAVDSVWVKPLPAGVYTYQVTTQSLTVPACTSPPRSVVVTIGLPTTITVQPVNQNVCLNNSASFTVVAAGTGLNYQWQVSSNGGATFSNIADGGLYSGASTATLNIIAPPISMSGNYFRAIVTGSAVCGTATSTAVTLTVNPIPTVVIKASPYYKLLPGLTTTLSSILSPNPAAAYIWLHDGIAVPGGTADTLLVDFTGIGFYKLNVTDIKGCTNFSNTIEIKDSALGRILINPNPAINGQFQLRMYSEPNTVLQRTLMVYNNMGVRVLTIPYTQTISFQKINVDIRSFGKGFYWIEVVDANGKRAGMTRVLVQ